MEYYILIFIADFLIAGQFSFNKLYEHKLARSNGDFLILPVLAALINCILFLVLNKFTLAFGTFSFGMAILNAFVQASSMVCGILVVRLGNVSVYTMFMMLGGMLLPYLYGVAFLCEKPSVFQIIGLFVLIAALILFALPPKNAEKKSTHKLFYVLCFLVFFLNGASSIIAKAHQINKAAIPTYDFLVWSYMMQFILTFVCFGVGQLIGRRKVAEGQPSLCIRSNPWMTVLVSAGYAICMGVGNLLLLTAVIHLPASVQYPIVTGGSIIITTIVARIAFKEKIGVMTLIGLGLMFAGVLLFIF